jgi:hypothetical protein
MLAIKRKWCSLIRRVVDFFQLNVITQHGFIPVDERMQVTDADGNVVCCKN